MTVNIHLLHYAVHYKKPERNKQELLQLMEEACRNGAQIIMTPEMALSGYSFTGREDISDCVEPEQSGFWDQVATLAKDYSCYICTGAALRDDSTGVFYNSAVVIGPQGVVLRYNKLNGECRWACSGDPQQDNTFMTPWGKVGVLICSDTYFEMVSRATALRGAELILVPANWPSLQLDPLELWRARAQENGVYIAVCNRTGQDKTMDCRPGKSCLIDPRGETVQVYIHPDTVVGATAIPLSEGRFAGIRREQQLAGRQPHLYHSVYRNLSGIHDLTSFFELPQPGTLDLRCLVPDPTVQLPATTMVARESRATGKGLWILPYGHYADVEVDQLAALAVDQGINLLLGLTGADRRWLLLDDQGQRHSWPVPEYPHATDRGIVQLEIGPAQVALVPYAALRHPELALSLSKQGCDLIIVSAEDLNDEIKLLCGVRTISQLAVTVCCSNGAGIWSRPRGHSPWGEQLTGQGGTCSLLFDTTSLRSKQFNDRFDHQLLVSCDFE